MGINIIKSLGIPNVMVQHIHNSRNTITSRRVLGTLHDTVLAGSTALHDKPYTGFHQKPYIGLAAHNATAYGSTDRRTCLHVTDLTNEIKPEN